MDEHAGLQLRIDLLGIKPAVWRRIRIPSRFTLDDLHTAIQHAFAWEDAHLHAFEIGGRHYSSPNSDGMGPARGALDGRKHRIGELAGNGDGFLYLYDFGSNWRHSVKVEEVIENADPVPLACLEGQRASPPEGCGGVGGYKLHFLVALKDPKHRDHADIMEMVDGEFDPDVFDLSATKARFDYWRGNLLRKWPGASGNRSAASGTPDESST